MQLAVCDDNKLYLKEIERQLRRVPFVQQISCFSSFDLLLRSVSGDEHYDAILMDIEWNRCENGIDMAEHLYQLIPNTKIIYVTGHGQEFAQQIFLQRSNLSGFLTKPVDQTLLEANLQKILDHIEQQDQCLPIKSNGKLVAIPISDIRYLESKGHAVIIHTSTEDITVYERLQMLTEKLPKSFLQCHKSYVINMRQVRRFQASDILLKTGEQIPVSRSRYASAKTAYFSFMGLEQ